MSLDLRPLLARLAVGSAALFVALASACSDDPMPDPVAPDA